MEKWEENSNIAPDEAALEARLAAGANVGAVAEAEAADSAANEAVTSASENAPQIVQNSFLAGFRDGIPIGLGYLSVSITFGMAAISGGLPVWAAVVISMTNVTSAGQFAGLELIFGGGSLFEMALTQLVINLRYMLMSISVSQKLHKTVTIADRMLFGFMMTDEVFAVTSGQKGEVGKRYLFGIMIAPYVGWAFGTLLGAVASEFMPLSIRSAFGVAIYGMFIAIVLPVARKSRAVLGVVALSIALSCAMHYLPGLNGVSSGFTIIICAVIASAVGAFLAPVPEKEAL